MRTEEFQIGCIQFPGMEGLESCSGDQDPAFQFDFTGFAVKNRSAEEIFEDIKEIRGMFSCNGFTGIQNAEDPPQSRLPVFLRSLLSAQFLSKFFRIKRFESGIPDKIHDAFFQPCVIDHTNLLILSE